MKRRRFLQITGIGISAAAVAAYIGNDRSNVVSANTSVNSIRTTYLRSDERQILYLASLAPSGHNTQPWMIKYCEPYHWIIANDRTKWLPHVDPVQRETMLSIGAFIQNLEYAAGHYGYNCSWTWLASSNQDEDVIEVKLIRATDAPNFDITRIQRRRTLRSGLLDDPLQKEHLDFLTDYDQDYFQFIPKGTKAYTWVSEQTIEANRVQIYRDTAQAELAKWIRFSNHEAQQNRDGLTTASMEIYGVPGWVLRHFYHPQDIMNTSFRRQSLDAVKDQVDHAGGWMLLTSNGHDTLQLIETGRRLQRMLLKARERNIAIHPMTQVLEEAAYVGDLQQDLGIARPVQFILRTGYVRKYPNPVSLRRQVDSFILN